MECFRKKERCPYEYDKNKTYNGPALFREFRDQFPLLVMVVEGEDGVTPYDNFSNDTKFRIHTYTRQRRVIVKETSVGHRQPSNPYFSYPVDLPYTFCVITSNNTSSKPMSLDEILKTHKCPVMVEFSPQVRYVQMNEYAFFDTDEIASLLIMMEYEENYLVGHCLEHGVMYPESAITALSPGIAYSVITGIEGKSPEIFQEHLKYLDNFLIHNNVHFNPNDGNPDITQATCKGTGTGNPIPEVVASVIPELKYNTPPPVPKKTPTGSKAAQIQNRKLPPIPVEHLPKQRTTAVVSPMRQQKEDPQCSQKKVAEYSFLDVSPVTDDSFRTYLQRCTVSDVSQCLRELRLDRHVDKFAEVLIDGAILVELSEEILQKELNLKRLEVVKLIKFIQTGHVAK